MFAIATILATLTTAADLRMAAWEGFHEGEDFCVTGIVTGVIEQDHNYAFADDTGFCYAKMTNGPALRPGDVAALSGKIEINERNWQNAFIRSAEVIGRRQPPPAIDITADRLNDSEYDSRPVRLCGIVADVIPDDIDPRWTFLLLRSDAGPFVAALPGADRAKLAALLGATATVKGLAFISSQSGRRRYSTPLLMVSSPGDISVVEPAPRNPFDAPRLPDDRILNLQRETPANIARMGLRRIDGRVLAVVGDRRILVRTDGGHLCGATLKNASPPKCGGRVAVVGFPETDLFVLNVSQAVWRRLPDDAPQDNRDDSASPPRVLAPDFNMEAVLRNCYGRLVRMRGVAVAPPSDGAAGVPVLSVVCDGRIVPVDVWPCREAAGKIAPGSEIEATGICLINTANWNALAPFPRIDGFTVVTRSADDLRVLRTPPWWTPARMLVVVVGLTVVLAAAFAWNHVLRLVVKRRSRQLMKAKVGEMRAALRVDERTRLAADIHDAVSQTLTGVSFHVDAAAKTLADGDPASATRFLSVSRKALQSCRRELRQCLWDLRSDTLELQDFGEAVRKTLAPVAGDAEVVVRFDINRRKLPDTTAHSVLCIIRELVANAARHGRARHICVTGETDGGALRFSVLDDGCGFDPDRRPGPAEGHFGLQGVKERVAQTDGSISVESAPGKGTRIVVEIGRKG